MTTLDDTVTPTGNSHAPDPDDLPGLRTAPGRPKQYCGELAVRPEKVEVMRVFALDLHTCEDGSTKFHIHDARNGEWLDAADFDEFRTAEGVYNFLADVHNKYIGKPEEKSQQQVGPTSPPKGLGFQ